MASVPFFMYLVFLALYILFMFVPPRLLTHYAPAYSERKFSQIRVGMSAGDVSRILSPPLHVEGCARGKEIWTYSASKNSRFFSGRWNHRALIFSNDLVVEIDKVVLYP